MFGPDGGLRARASRTRPNTSVNTQLFQVPAGGGGTSLHWSSRVLRTPRPPPASDVELVQSGVLQATDPNGGGGCLPGPDDRDDRPPGTNRRLHLHGRARELDPGDARGRQRRQRACGRVAGVRAGRVPQRPGLTDQTNTSVNIEPFQVPPGLAGRYVLVVQGDTAAAPSTGAYDLQLVQARRLPPPTRTATAGRSPAGRPAGG